MNVMLLTASHRAIIVILGDDRHHSSVLVLLLSPSVPLTSPQSAGQTQCPSTHLYPGNYGGPRLSRLRLLSEDCL